MYIDEVTTPAALIDVDILRRNIAGMADRAAKYDVALRPHIKTHKCLEIGRLQLSAGASGITVASLVEAGIFAEAGFRDITCAVPIVPDKFSEALRLARRCNLGLLLDDASIAEQLAQKCGAIGVPLKVWLKVDCGHHRAGVRPDSDEAVIIARSLQEAPAVEFAGLLTHAGHSYQASSKNEVLAIALSEKETMLALREKLAAEGLGRVQVSVGATPTNSLDYDLTGIDEIRPGNYVFHDRTQVLLGTCNMTDCAFTVLASVISRQPSNDYAVIDAGALALSHDPGPLHLDSTASRGIAFMANHNLDAVSNLRVASVSQEHGII
ncbi:MAG: alanine racemase, partial [Candidatus Marinimicrobia bacterium]|nr:alanine racemase [Candidatus Neomarinimicrobiota bacterium]